MNTQISPYERTKTLLRSEDVQVQFRAILGQKKAAGLIASVINTIYNDPKLRDAEPSSILSSAMQAAILDLPVDPNLGFAAIAPFNRKIKVNGQWQTRKEATFMVMKRGLVQLALRTRQYEVINAGPVYEGEKVIKDRITGEIRMNGQQVSDKAIGYFGYFRLKDGFQHYDYMTVEQIHAHGKRYSKSYGNDNSKWTTDFGEMAEKTLVRRILRHGPLSLELSEALKKDEEQDTQDERINGDLDIPEPEYIDVEANEMAGDETEQNQQQPINPDPITDKSWKEWETLCKKAEATGVKFPVINRERTTQAEMREIYNDLYKDVPK